jgi:hypothetical protein
MLGWFKKIPQPSGPDFSHIDSREKLEQLFLCGDLEKLFLMPLEFRGLDISLNTLYGPVGLAPCHPAFGGRRQDRQVPGVAGAPGQELHPDRLASEFVNRPWPGFQPSSEVTYVRHR